MGNGPTSPDVSEPNSAGKGKVRFLPAASCRVKSMRTGGYELAASRKLTPTSVWLTTGGSWKI